MATVNRDLVEVTACELQEGDHVGSVMRRRVVAAPQHLPGGRRVRVVMQWDGSGKRETIDIAHDWRGRVLRQVAGTGMARRHRARSRATGGIVEVWDTEHRDSPIHPHAVKGHKWAIRCEHGTTEGRQTLTEAVKDARNPQLWCTSCGAGVGAQQLPL